MSRVVSRRDKFAIRRGPRHGDKHVSICLAPAPTGDGARQPPLSPYPAVPAFPIALRASALAVALVMLVGSGLIRWACPADIPRGRWGQLTISV